MNLEYRKELRELYDEIIEKTKAIIEKHKNVEFSGLDGPRSIDLKQLKIEQDRRHAELKKKYNIK